MSLLLSVYSHELYIIIAYTYTTRKQYNYNKEEGVKASVCAL